METSMAGLSATSNRETGGYVSEAHYLAGRTVTNGQYKGNHTSGKYVGKSERSRRRLERARELAGDVPEGLCLCGCGGETEIAPITISAQGWKAGKPKPFIRYHHQRGVFSWRHRPGGYRHSNGRYWYVKAPEGHHSGRPTIGEHVLVAERALGKPLPKGTVVHHVNEDTHDNRPENLVICPSKAYHELLHVRLRALKGCGNPDWRRCRHCREWDAMENLRKAATNWEHPKCSAQEWTQRSRRKNRDLKEAA